MVKLFYVTIIYFLFVQNCASLKCYNTICYTLYISNVTDNEGGKDSINSTWIAENGKYNGATSSCVEPGYEKVCSGHGYCKSGICECDKVQSQENDTESLYEYSGRYCEECPYCKGQRCQKLLPCVESVLRNLNGSTSCYIHYNTVDGDVKLNYNDKLCHVEDSNKCMVTFKYFYDDDDEIIIDIDREVKCLNGKRYIMFCWCIFIIYIIVLMIIFKIL